MAERNIAILGSTGSIGKSTLDVIDRHPGYFNVRALAAYSNVELLAEQCRKYHPDQVCIVDESRLPKLKELLGESEATLSAGTDELLALTTMPDVDLVVNAVVGAAGLMASLETIKAGRTLALANKESLVAGGPLFPRLLKEGKGRILPIDSEHSAIWQALNAGKPSELRRIIITASGGPFRTLPKEKFAEITLEQALDHPTWKMGPKITIDSSTLANKGLEVIEAVSLFQVPVSQVEVVVHPQSIVHSMVEFKDSAIIAQLSNPDMRLPITCALFWPDRVESEYGRMDFSEVMRLDFEPPDFEKFPALKLAFEVAETGGTAPAIFNAANEVAVERFLNREIGYMSISRTIRNVVEKITVVDNPKLEDILYADQTARKEARLIQED